MLETLPPSCPRVEALLMRAARRAIDRRASLERRQRLGERIYDGTRLNPAGCTRCSLPFVCGEADHDEVCRLCVIETAARPNWNALATANCMRHLYAAMRTP